MDQTQGEQVELYISCRGLKNLNNLYLTDPQVYAYEIKDNQKRLIGHTEPIKHNLNPDFKTTIKTTYYFFKNQDITLEILDSNESILGKVTELAISGERKENFVGEVNTTLSNLLGAPNCLSKLPVYRNHSKHGKMVIFIDKVKEQSQVTNIDWQWNGRQIKDMDWFSKSDPFAKFFRYNVGTDKILIHQTEVIKDNLDPVWKPWQTTKEQLCSKTDQFYVEVWDYNRVGGHSFIGSCDISISDILDKNITDFKLLTKKKKDAGHLQIKSKTISKPPPIKKEITFLDYLRGGWQLSLVAGIDFTFSNGPINKADSLHAIKKDELNQYQLTIKNVGGIIISYDFDKEVPLYGFGGIPKLDTYTKPFVDDCFPINGNEKNPQCKDVDGIMKAYEEAVPKIEFSGPTFVSNILEKAKLAAKANVKENIYTVALIMTDGQIEDMEQAMQLIGECSEYPMSIIIIGVGDENFSYMKILEDVNKIKAQVKGDAKEKVRDITQFVAINEFAHDPELLGQKVLSEFPEQFMDYMRLHKIEPKEVLAVSLSSIQEDE